MGVAVWFIVAEADTYLGHGLMQNYLVLALVSGIGFCLYALAALGLRAYGISDIRYATGRDKT